MKKQQQKSSQSGIAHVAIIVLVIVIAVVGFAGWKVWKSQGKTADVASDLPLMQKSTSQESTADAVTNISVAEKGKLVLPNGHADPTIAKTKDGYRMYVNRQSGGPSGILIYNSPDGITWTKEKDIIIPGASTSRAVAMADGIRLYYPGPQPIRPTDAQADMLSAFSTDGLNFTKETGSVIEPRSAEYYVEGPTVFQLPDNSWRMYFNENTVAAKMQRDGEIWGASSADGKTWKRDDKVTLQADEAESQTQGNMTAPWKQVLHPFVLKNPKGGYIMFYNSHSEIYAATSTDGLTWKKIGKVGIHGADIDGYFQADGTIRVYYGDFSPETGGLVYMALLKVQ